MQPSSEIWSLNRKLMADIFLEKLYTKCGGDNIPRLKIQKLGITLHQ